VCGGARTAGVVAILAEVLSPGSPPRHRLAPKANNPPIVLRVLLRPRRRARARARGCEKPRSVCRWPAGRTGESAIIEESRIGDDAARCVRAFRRGSDYRLVAAGAAMRERCPDLGALATLERSQSRNTRDGMEGGALSRASDSDSDSEILVLFVPSRKSIYIRSLTRWCVVEFGRRQRDGLVCRTQQPQLVCTAT
jgi:hypothetical protein